MDKAYDVFISHSSSDRALAFSICDYLEKRKIKCWIAPRNVNSKAGKEYAESIIEGIRASKIMVVIFNQNANKSAFLKKEVERAAHYELTILPFKTDDSAPIPSLELFLSSIQWLEAIEGSPENYFGELYENCAWILGKAIEPEPNFPDYKADDNKNSSENNVFEKKKEYVLPKPSTFTSARGKKNVDTNYGNANFDKKPIWQRVAFACVLGIPVLLLIPLFFYGLVSQAREHRSDIAGWFAWLWILCCDVVGCLAIIKFIRRYLKKIKPAKGTITPVIAAQYNFSPFYMAKKDGKYALQPCIWMAYIPVLGIISGGLLGLELKSGVEDYFIALSLVVFLLHYIFIACSLFSKASAKYRVANLVIAVFYILNFALCVRWR